MPWLSSPAQKKAETPGGDSSGQNSERKGQQQNPNQPFSVHFPRCGFHVDAPVAGGIFMRGRQ
jgi:hypothetical protein